MQVRLDEYSPALGMRRGDWMNGCENALCTLRINVPQNHSQGAPQPRKSPPSCPPPPGEGEGGGDFRDGLGNGSRFGLFFGSKFLLLQEKFLPHKNDPLTLQIILEEQIKNNSPSIPIDYANILIPLQKPCCERNSCKIVKGETYTLIKI